MEGTNLILIVTTNSWKSQGEFTEIASEIKYLARINQLFELLRSHVNYSSMDRGVFRQGQLMGCIFIEDEINSLIS